MKLFTRKPIDAMFAINRCYFEADNGRPSLAIDRLQDLAQELPANPHVSYAEGIIRRDHLGEGKAAFICFRSAYEYGSSQLTKRNTVRLAAYNATMLAPTASDFRKWAELSQRACGWWHRNDRRFLA
ncbi:hypothetical protein OAS39_09275, partial [Pirellulales bacterium]|nr:hypothetical protein [Pirellulales bacterium]